MNTNSEELDAGSDCGGRTDFSGLSLRGEVHSQMAGDQGESKEISSYLL